MKETIQVIRLPEDVQKEESTEKSPGFKLDDVLSEIGGFGRYQLIVAICMGLISTYGSFIVLNFMFTSAIPEHRCFIPECEQIGSTDFHTEWLKYAIPYNNEQLDSCSRYAYIGAGDSKHEKCSASNFNQSNVIPCDSFITKNNEIGLASHLNMLCTGQNTKFTLLGTASTLGRFLAMPVSGVISDKYGRIITVIVCTIFGAIFTTLQALPASLMTFELYWAFEFLASLLSTGMIGASYIFNMEWVTAEYRVRANNILLAMEILIAYPCISLAAWYFADNFIAYKVILAVPGFLAVFLYFLLGESPKWLLTQNKHSQAIDSISKAGRINGRPLQAHTIQQIEYSSTLASSEKSNDEQSNKVSLMDLLRNRVLAFRLFIVSIVWMCTFFAFFGILLKSTNVHSNKYLSFWIIGLADLPATVINTFLMNRIGRKITIGIALPIYALMLFISTQVPTEGVYQLILFAISKAAVKTAMLGLYIFTSEFWPTSIRNTAYNIGMMSARFGGIIATVTGLLAEYYVNLPLFLYASAAILGSIVLLVFLPETMGVKLPDTIEEALAVGKKQQKSEK